jgi:tetratricopeptide (TPR) repeat protein
VYTWDASRAYDFSGEVGRAATREFIRLAPDNLGFWKHRGDAYAQLGDFERAASEFSKGVEPNVQHAFSSAWMHAYALLGTARLDEYRRACARLAEAFGDGPVAWSRGLIAWQCALAPDPLVAADKLVTMAEAARDNYVFDSSNLTYGACLYRTGRLDDAVAALSAFAEAIDRGGDVYDQYHLACAKYFLALARHDLGHDFQAHRHLREANRLTEGLSDRLSQPWRRHIELDVLRQEATAAIGD